MVTTRSKRATTVGAGNSSTHSSISSSGGGGGGGIGRRGWVYVALTATLLGWAVVGWGGVILKWWPPHPTDDYCAITTFFCLWMPVAAFWDNPGERRTWAQRAEEFVFVWLLESGLAQTLWELPFVLIKSRYIQPIRSTETLDDSELWLWGFWMYGSGDTRYMRFHPETHATETLLAISGPLELWAAWMLHTDQRYKAAMVVAALTHWGFFWANTSVIYIAEIYAGYQWVADGWVGFWFKWGGLNLQWSVLSPLCTYCALHLLAERCHDEGRRRGK